MMHDQDALARTFPHRGQKTAPRLVNVAQQRSFTKPQRITAQVALPTDPFVARVAIGPVHQHDGIESPIVVHVEETGILTRIERNRFGQ